MAANPRHSVETPGINGDERRRLIAEAAYFRALERGFVGGDPLIDWLDAEREVDARFEPVPYDGRLEVLYENLARANEKLRELVVKFSREAERGCNEELEHAHKLRNAFCERLTAMRQLGGEAGRRARQDAEARWRDLVEVMRRMGVNLD